MNSPNLDLATVAHAARRWALESALPYWATTGFDGDFGGFHERLGPDGAPDSGADRRVRVQARQIYVYAHAAALGWFPEGKTIALNAFDTMVERYRSPDGAPGFAHTVARDGTLDNPLRDAYDHAFILLALAWLARATGDAQVRAMIDDVLSFLDEHLAAGDGTYHEGLPRSAPRRQNPHMHLFEAMLALHETVGHPEALGRAARLRALLETHFLSSRFGVLVEYFSNTWMPMPSDQPVEPGHHAEWSWLLRRHAHAAGLPADPRADRLLQFALSVADPATGLLPELVQPDGLWSEARYRLWAQTELAKGLLAGGEGGDEHGASAAASALDRVLRRYLERAVVPGAWIERLGAGGVPILEAIPASSLYHLFGAIAEAARVTASSAR